MFPNGQSNWHARGSMGIFSQDLGQATATRTPQQIAVDTSKGRVSVTQDPHNPDEVNLSFPNVGNFSGTLRTTSTGFQARTSDGRTLNFDRQNGSIQITGQGFQQLEGTTISLTPG